MSAHPIDRSIPAQPHDAALVEDFFLEWDAAAAALEATLAQLVDVQSPALLDQLFRTLHTLKSNLRMMDLAPCAELTHRLEDLLDDMRRGVLPFDAVVGDLFLLSVNALRDVAERLLAGDTRANASVAALLPLLERMHHDPANARQPALAAIALLDAPENPGQAAVSEAEADLAFFRSIALATESRPPYRSGATTRVEAMACALNQLAGTPVDALQLRAAAILHDVGMAWLPSSLRLATGVFGPQQHRMLHPHPRTAANLLNQLPQWAQAQRIILQHHERIDGQGYPLGEGGAHIHPGAKVLAIVDAFEAMTQVRSYRQHRRPVLHAVTEINAKSGSQFDPDWVDIFNRWMRQPNPAA